MVEYNFQFHWWAPARTMFLWNLLASNLCQSQRLERRMKGSRAALLVNSPSPTMPSPGSASGVQTWSPKHPACQRARYHHYRSFHYYYRSKAILIFGIFSPWIGNLFIFESRIKLIVTPIRPFSRNFN